MILDQLSHADRVLDLHPRFGEAFAFLRDVVASGHEDGRIDIDGDALYAMLVREEGRGREAARLESHRDYIDIQYAVSGDEIIGWSPAGNAYPGEGYDDQRDVEFHTGTPQAWLPTPPGAFAVFFPTDLHAPLAGSGPIVKLVVKIHV